MQLSEIFSTPTSVLTEAQRHDFYENGYILLPGIIPDDLLVRLRAGLDRAVEESRSLTKSTDCFDLEPGHSADAPRLRRATYLDDTDDPVFWELCADSILPDVAADLLGPNVRFRDLMMNFKWADGGAEVKWHQDAPFYPHTNHGTLQVLIFVEDVTLDQGPLQLVPGSHKGPLFPHYDEAGEWIGAINDTDLKKIPFQDKVTLTGPAGTVSIHHSFMVHGSAPNTSATGRPAFVITYAAADAIPYTAPPYPSSHYGALVRGKEPGVAHHETMVMPLPPDWSDGYTSIFAHQDEVT